MRLIDVGDVITQYVDPLLWLVTARSGTERGGLIATFVHNVSLVPEFPRVIVGLARQHHTWKLIEGSRAFALHLLGEDNLEWVARFGLRSGRDCDKFAGLIVKDAPSGSPVLEAALLWLDCQVEASMDTGDRTFYVGEVVATNKGAGEVPIRFKQMLDSLADDTRQELDSRLARDRQIDAAAITKWRMTSTGRCPSI